VFVLVGDGELQEGQIWEALQTTAHQGVNLTVIVDHNKIQTDMPVDEIIGLGRLDDKFRSFGWAVDRCDGHDFAALAGAWVRLAGAAGPKILIADTVKGRGVSFMEKIAALASAQGKYLWHSGAPDDEPYRRAFAELRANVDERLAALGMSPLGFQAAPGEATPESTVNRPYVAAAYGDELVRLAETHPELVVLDGDLAADCRVRAFAEKYPDRFIENGIAEQDMVSMAGGLARQGLLPVCNSFGSFLCARANEQIYNNCCEGTKIIYAAHFAGMIPAGPGRSHQSVRDIGLLGSLPELVMVQPGSPEEARLATRWAVEEASGSVCLRMNIGPSPGNIRLPDDYRLCVGRGCWLRAGVDAIVFAYGAVMLHEALLGAELAAQAGVSIAVVDFPWLNRFDVGWIAGLIGPFSRIYTIDDHLIPGGMGQRFVAALADNGLLADRHALTLGLQTLPSCGRPSEVLRHHGLDGASLAKLILEKQAGNAPQGRP